MRNIYLPAEIAQLVEHNLAKVGVASSSLVFRSQRIAQSSSLFRINTIKDFLSPVLYCPYCYTSEKLIAVIEKE